MPISHSVKIYHHIKKNFLLGVVNIPQLKLKDERSIFVKLKLERWEEYFCVFQGEMFVESFIIKCMVCG